MTLDPGMLEASRRKISEWRVTHSERFRKFLQARSEVTAHDCARQFCEAVCRAHLQRTQTNPIRENLVSCAIERDRMSLLPLTGV